MIWCPSKHDATVAKPLPMVMPRCARGAGAPPPPLSPCTSYALMWATLWIDELRQKNFACLWQQLGSAGCVVACMLCRVLTHVASQFLNNSYWPLLKHFISGKNGTKKEGVTCCFFLPFWMAPLVEVATEGTNPKADHIDAITYLVVFVSKCKTFIFQLPTLTF